MPSRRDASASSASTRKPRTSARASRGENQSTEKTDDVWDDIMSMKNGGDDGQFNKMNTNFYLKDGEEIDIVLLDENPFIFWGHTIKCKSNAGKTFYRIEQCQKSEQDYCVLCESDNKAIGKAKKIIAFRLLDSRGSWDIKAGGFDGNPAPKIFLTPLYLAKQFKALKDDAGGNISDKVIKLSKSSNYIATLKMKNVGGGNLKYTDAPEFDGDTPEVLEVYAPMEDDDLIDFIRQFADATPNATANSGNGGTNSRRGGGSTAGSFGD